jgi:hypothetical protein
MGRIYDVCRWDDIRWHDINRFHDHRFRNSTNTKALSQKFLRLQCWYYCWELRICDVHRGMMYLTKIHEYWYRFSNNTKGIYLNSFRGYSAGITDERDLSRTPLKWPQVAYYIRTKFREDWFRRSSNIKVVQKFVLVLLMGGIYGARRWDALM